MARIRKLKTQEVSLVDKAANKREYLVIKAAHPEGTQMSEKEAEKCDSAEDVKKSLDALDEASRAEILKSFEAPEKESVIKANGDLNIDILPEETKEEMQALWKSHKDLVAKNEIIEKRLMEQQDEKALAEFVEVAKSYENLPVKHEDFGLVLKKAAAVLSEDELDLIKKVASFSSEKSQSLFTESGHAQSVVVAGGAKEEFNSKVAEIQKSDKVEFYPAFELATKRNQALFKEMQAEDRKARSTH